MNPADLILHNGKFATMDPGLPKSTAVAMAGGRFLAVVGLSKSLRYSITDTTREIFR
jgi:predicted amidohydrolase YtcJ